MKKIKKVAIYYPVILKNNKYPLLSQNRQFKYSKSQEIRIYPLIMSTLATMLNDAGYEVLFLDGINKRLSPEKCRQELLNFKPDVIILESKAPLFDLHIEILKDLKQEIDPINIICGDHVSFFYENAVKESSIDYVVISGYYDFIINELISAINSDQELPAGVFYQKNEKIHGNKKIKEYDLDQAPIIDRELTQAHLYGEAYLYKPAAYILSGRGCGGANTNSDDYTSSLPGRCTFCIWQHVLWCTTARLRSPASVADEIDILVNKYKYKEIFDDNESGGTWNEKWLNDFYIELDKRNLIGKFFLSSNARADALTKERVSLLKKIGYRLLKIGLESANNETLKKIVKDETIDQIEQGVKNAKDAGLVVLMTTMVGYPWETEAEALKTYQTTRKLMLYKTHFGDSLQSSIFVPYPGSPLYNLAVKNNLLTEDGKDFTKYDMDHTVLNTNINPSYWCNRMWKIHLHPIFLLKSLLSIRRFLDLKLAFIGIISLFGHLKDYKE